MKSVMVAAGKTEILFTTVNQAVVNHNNMLWLNLIYVSKVAKFN